MRTELLKYNKKTLKPQDQYKTTISVEHHC